MFDLLRLVRQLPLAALLLSAVTAPAQTEAVTLATLNCYWFFIGGEGKANIGKAASALAYGTKLAHNHSR